MNIPKTAVRNFITYFIVFSIPVISLVFFTHTQLIKKFQTTTYNLELSYQNNKLNDFEQNINKLIDIASQIKISETELNENIMSRIDLIAVSYTHLSCWYSFPSCSSSYGTKLEKLCSIKILGSGSFFLRRYSLYSGLLYGLL